MDISEDPKTTELSNGFSWSFYNVAALGTAIFVVSVGISTVLALPLLAQKLCYSFGIFCLDPFSGFEGYRSVNVNDRHKRSLEYVEPVLTMLMQAYEMYANDDIKKKSEVLKF
ncbi:hypothetical protein HHI36_023131 [Cryptolaemus montrouzieri]|uniref:Uncharacterized protein n=1 Tax=Cryptolaemus montrouzieri TaxID=559131 RepID=A0ABD2PFV8_9CUCU